MSPRIVIETRPRPALGRLLLPASLSGVSSHRRLGIMHTREAEFEIPVGKPELDAFIIATREPCNIQTDSLFGWADPTKPPTEQRLAQGVKLGRPKIDCVTERKVRKQLAKGMGILNGVVDTVPKIVPAV